jgi:CRP/FNR family transcriptional regulator
LNIKDKYFNNSKNSILEAVELNDSEWDFLKSNFNLVQYKKGEHILTPGDRSDVLYFVGRGLLKRYFLSHEDKKIITSFDEENRTVSDFVALIKESPAQIYIRAIEDTDVLVSNYGISQLLFKNSPIWEKYGRIITEKRYLEKCEREYNLLHFDAIERFHLFKRDRPELFARLSQKLISCYLGVTPESLSRMIKKDKVPTDS